MSDTEHGSKELAVCKNQLAHFRAAAKRLREQREQLRTDFALAESKVLMLTDELEHLKAENAKLWELGEQYETVLADYRSEVAKLRELARLVAYYVSADQCEGCVTKHACNAGELDMCWIRKAILKKLRELDMEV